MTWKVSYSRSLTVRAVGIKVGGRAPSGVNHLSPHKYWIESWKQNFWVVENGCCFPCKVGVSCVNLYKSNTLFAYHACLCFSAGHVVLKGSFEPCFVQSSVNPTPVKSPYLSVKQIEWPGPDRRPCSYQTRWSVTRTQYSAWAMSHYKDPLSRYGDSHDKDKTRDLLIFMMRILTLVSWYLHIETHIPRPPLDERWDVLWKRSREISKPWEIYIRLELSDCSEMWQAP